MDFSGWANHDYAAWWGAVVATAAFTWNVVSALRSGPRIRVRAMPNMQTFPRIAPTGDKTWICVTAVNRGSGPTTITHFCGFHAKTIWKVLRRQGQNFVVPTGAGIGTALPHVLRPGEEWSGMIDQEDVLRNTSRGYLYVGVIHNQRRRPVYVRVPLSRLTQPEGGTKQAVAD